MSEHGPARTSRRCCAARWRRSSRPSDLAARLEATLTTLTELAAEELEAWELSAMRDPRNWVRPVAAAAIGTAAGAGLVVLRVRASQKRRHAQGRSPASSRAARCAPRSTTPAAPCATAGGGRRGGERRRARR